MRVLYVTGSCLTKNTSANMSHNGYVQGLLENGAQVDIIMAKDSWGEPDPVFLNWDQAHYYIYGSESLKDRLRKKARSQFTNHDSLNANELVKGKTNDRNISVRSILKKLFYLLFPSDPLYPLEEKWLKNARHFKNNEEYDIVISNSSPAAGHKLVSVLRNKNRVKYDKWVQIWEDPWFYDLYGGHTQAQKEEEHELLKQADLIYYVSPLTLMYQKRYFPDCSNKMCFIPLPAFDFVKEDPSVYKEDTFGYFGDYFSQTRDLLPFYKAAKKAEIKTYIIGDSDLDLSSGEKIKVMSRMTLKELAVYQNKTKVLVHLCNLKGGQIPGKIYHYSITAHPILFILDGNKEEKEEIFRFFSKYDRYVFCENEEDSIEEAIKEVLNHKEERPVEDFYPKNIVKELIDNCL